MREVTAPHCSGPTFAVAARVFSKNVRFLIDTGAEVSALPPSFQQYAFPVDVHLVAANGTPIRNYGAVAADIHFPKMRRCYTAKFVVADVRVPILGADFFERHKLLIDVANQRLVDNETQLTVNLVNSNDTPIVINLVEAADPQLLKVLQEHTSVFDISAPRPLPTIEFSIENTEIPKASKSYRFSPDKVAAAKTEIENEIKLGRMVRSSSEYAAPFFPVRKPDNSWRFVADYSALNNVTRKDQYMPPRIDDLLSRIPRACVFSKLDLQKAFYLIPIRKEDQHKTAVATPFGLYEYTVMPMGLKNASQTLQRYVDTVLAGDTNVIVYCDDILLFTSKADHIQALDTLLQKLHAAGLVVNRQKSQFFCDTVKFLGHTLSSNGYTPTQERVKALQTYAPPKNLRQLRRFLGMFNFLRKFIPSAASIEAPLTALTRKDTPYEWSEQCQNAFDRLVELASTVTQLHYPSPEDEYILTTDASSTAVGAILMSQNGPIGFFSKQLHGAELNYCTYDKELTAVFKAVHHFEWLLFGRSFTLRVDHKPLLHLFNKSATTERRRRHIEYLSTFELRIEHIAGKDNIVADALSRDKSLDTLRITTELQNLPRDQLRQLQEKDTDFSKIPPHHRSLQSDCWYDSFGRLIVPEPHRNHIIEAVHLVAHAGFRSTLAQIQTSYVWPRMRHDVKLYVDSCTSCQSAKITRHTKPPYTHLGVHNKFEAIHIDFVGPLPAIQNKRYLVTIFDRGTRWFAAYPVSHPTAESASNALVTWVSTFGVPTMIVSDQGSHFEALLFKSIVKQLGIAKCRTTAYHPAGNAVERQHRRLKEALRARSINAPKTWLSDLPLVVLGLNNAVSSDTSCSAAFATFGRQLHLPNCIFDGHFNLFDQPPIRDFQRRDACVPEDLRTCTFVWLRRPCKSQSLQRPYYGPFKVLYRNFGNHTMLIDLNGQQTLVNMARVKPAFAVSNTCIQTQPQSVAIRPSRRVSFSC